MSGAGVTSDFLPRSQSVLSKIEQTLAGIEALNPALNAFTRVLGDEALAAARLLDARKARGEDLGPLAGLSFAVKDLFDLKGYPTTAGAKMRLDAPAATEDAEVVKRLKAAGAVCVGTLNMDEYAYGFATVNAHFGTTRNPHDPGRLAGGSSGGSAAAVAAGLVDIALGSDTNGSVRVPASLCGVWGLRPGAGAIPQDGVFPFVERFDEVGAFTRSASGLALAYSVLSGRALNTPLVARKNLRMARLGGFFARNASPEVTQAFDEAMQRLGVAEVVEIPGDEAARSAAFLITAAEGGELHLETLRERAMDYDPAVRDRLLAGAMIPAALYGRTFEFVLAFKDIIAEIKAGYDVLFCPATPVFAPRLEDTTIMVDGVPGLVRAQLGLYAQAITLSGLPVVSAPIHRSGLLPIGIQMIGAGVQMPELLALAQTFEAQSILAFSPPLEFAGKD